MSKRLACGEIKEALTTYQAGDEALTTVLQKLNKMKTRAKARLTAIRLVEEVVVEGEMCSPLTEVTDEEVKAIRELLEHTGGRLVHIEGEDYTLYLD